MRHIRRAAVTGLMAVWLAPLSAFSEGQAAGAALAQSARLEAPMTDREGAALPEAAQAAALREARRRLLSK
ncbi:hypothetical protein [Falsiroseomonas sp.]|uniref:hypothetical protein n=1 Tax=Falsiroseomonas sp. TaxID=2870721 RepID=UPI003F71F987